MNRRKVGWKNPTEPAKFPDFANPDHFDKMWDWIYTDNMLQAPGFVDIPICGIDEIANNIAVTKNDYYSWPCNPELLPAGIKPVPQGHKPAAHSANFGPSNPCPGHA